VPSFEVPDAVCHRAFHPALDNLDRIVPVTKFFTGLNLNSDGKVAGGRQRKYEAATGRTRVDFGITSATP